MRQVVLVNPQDDEIGITDVDRAHSGHGLLHRAVSVVIFRISHLGLEILIQKRSHEKRLWPHFWSNTVCTHPAPKEIASVAAVRRLREELGIELAVNSLRLAGKIQYQKDFRDVGAENELDSIYIARWNGVLNVDPKEVAETKWAQSTRLWQDMENNPASYTPWFQLFAQRQIFLDAFKQEALT